jgi:hypothetical protein
MSGPCKPQKFPPAPSDSKVDGIYERLVKEAGAVGLVTFAYGGVATLAIPSEQRKAGIRGQVLEAAELSEPLPYNERNEKEEKR